MVQQLFNWLTASMGFTQASLSKVLELQVDIRINRPEPFL